MFASPGLHAGSATWNLNPGTNNWNTALNWTPATVPNAQGDVATFGPSNTTAVTVQDRTFIGTSVASIIFSADAPAYTVTLGNGSLNQTNFDFWGTGVTNNSTFEHTFVLPTLGSSNSSQLSQLGYRG